MTTRIITPERAQAEQRDKPRKNMIMAAVMTAMFMAALEGTVISTAMPSIARSFGDISNYSWVFAAYLLGQTATSLVFGRLADTIGRRTAILIGLAIFLSGSLLCGFAWSLPALICFRAFQGVGAGAIMPISMTIIGDLYPPQQRGKAQSLVATVFGTSSVVGPMLGGAIVQSVSWSWIFWINIPVALAAMLAFRFLLPAHERNEGGGIRMSGSFLFMGALTAALLSLSWFGNRGPEGVIALALASALLLAFLMTELNSPAPLFVPSVWKSGHVAIANLATFCGASVIIAITAFLPLFMQALLQATPLKAGLALTAIAMGWPLGATFAGWYQLKIGLARTMLGGSVLILLGSIFFATLDAGSSFLHAASGSFFVGMGMGLLTSAAMIMVQESVTPAERGTATGSNIFARNLGSVIGASIFGVVFNASVSGQAGGLDIHAIEARIASDGFRRLPTDVAQDIGMALNHVFVAMAILAALCVVVAILNFRRGKADAEN
jgi:EmrB/QacA subfamily drug resistance transporter